MNVLKAQISQLITHILLMHFIAKQKVRKLVIFLKELAFYCLPYIDFNLLFGGSKQNTQWIGQQH